MQEMILDRLGNGWGELHLEGLQLYALENPAKQIPAGTYKVILTESGRAKRGTLWTPWPEFKLPELLNVPGRTAIRIHAANKPEQLEGCIAVGLDRTKDMLLRSRLALEDLRDQLWFSSCWITITDPKKEA